MGIIETTKKSEDLMKSKVRENEERNQKNLNKR